MNEDAAFIRAIRERPDDETSRLVYTDWLDDRADPRAEYLRAEAAWVALQPSDEQYRPLYRRVSQLAAALDPEWFAAVSRMGHLARSEWARVARRWGPYQRRPETDLIREWDVSEGELLDTFRHYLGLLPAEQRFCVPVDYRAFMTTVGGGWQRNDEWDELYSGERMRRETSNSADVFGGEPNDHLEMWIDVAASGDMHRFLLCCDLDCTRFGEVAEAEDYHPWMHSGSAPLRTRNSTFLHFLACWLAID